jgi:hypothetical protein
MTTIWASIIHLSDEYFSGAGDLDILICEALIKDTYNKQTWMINPVWLNLGTTSKLLHISYIQIRDSVESYLVLITPGFADALENISAHRFENNLEQICMRAKSFNKSVIGVLVGIPPKCPVEIEGKIKKFNEITKSVIIKYKGYLVDLTEEGYESWSAKGSRPVSPESVARKIADVVMGCHPGMVNWRNLHK